MHTRNEMISFFLVVVMKIFQQTCVRSENFPTNQRKLDSHTMSLISFRRVRVCVCMYECICDLAEKSVRLLLATILSVFHIFQDMRLTIVLQAYSITHCGFGSDYGSSLNFELFKSFKLIQAKFNIQIAEKQVLYWIICDFYFLLFFFE